PESVSGALAAQRFETYGLALDQKFPTQTYLGISAELLRSEDTQTVGTYDFLFPDLTSTPSGTRQHLKFEEKSLSITLNQLISNEISVGTRYQLRHADLNESFPDLPASAFSSPAISQSQHPSGTLHQLHLYAIYNHPSGFFSQFQSVWSVQSNSGYSPDQPGDDFWQFNAFVGYRFPRRYVELSVGVLNITDRDYRLNPLTLYAELPRERTAVVTLKINF
ncbi:MAG TPA: hypothetical protein VKM56_15270, partial [Verrucomicrobiae bacterium]|nr:hypothetical protein [Verrucomicrobiae bacterium]